MKLFSDIKLSASIAFTHMRAKLRQTIVATAGVAFGITVFIFMVGFIIGVNDFTRNVLFEQSAHLRLFNEARISETTILDEVNPGSVNIVHNVRPKDELLNLKDGKLAVNEIRHDPRVKSISGTASSMVFYRLGSGSVNGIVKGIEFEDENEMFNINDKLIEGSFRELSIKPNSIVMGVSLASQLNVRTGDLLNLTTEKGGNFLVTVVGIFRTGITEIDKRQSYASLNTVQRFLGVPASYINEINVNLYDMDIAPEVSKEFQTTYDYEGSDWMIDNATFLETEVLRNMVAYGVAVTILLVAGFGIFNILTMMIYEKMKDIAILKAMGFSDSDVRSIFLTQAMIIGVTGSLLGLLFGFLISYGLSKVPFEADIMITLDHLPVSFAPVYYISGFIFGLLTTLLAGYLPSRNAAKVDPLTILRG